ncbi:GerAB/ArcD/ProY family transporter [Desmospora profundinema]|uniref:Spore germination protein n=1 Tax=Desmospora profundinema TaxID=1571184 RepID=A0ABU1IR07_9BACL|nr:endospore germination permease [Desmospora profundinema]MDR6227236.1 spore germination protein [Desmospora profundinema]
MSEAKQDVRHEGRRTITPYQSHCLVVTTVVGVGILSFQRGVVEDVGPDAVWTILIGGLIVLGEVALLTMVMQRFSEGHLVGAIRELAGNERSRWFTTLMAAPFVLLVATFWFSATSYVTRTFGEVLISAVLPWTPLEVLMPVILGVAAVVASHRLDLVARFSELLMPLLYLPMPLFVVGWIQEGKWNNFLPLFEVNWPQVFHGVLGSFLAYSGISVLLAFMGYYRYPHRAMSAHLSGVGVVVFFYWLTVAASVAVFGMYEIRNLMWPTLDLITVTAVPGMILERLESAFLAIWMVAVFTTLINLYGALVDAIMNWFQMKEKRRPYVSWFLFPFIFMTAYLPPNLPVVFRWGDWSGWYEPVVIVIILLFLFLLSVFRGKESERGQADALS